MAEARTFACPSCGASLTIRALEHTAAVACAQCGSVIDAKDPDLRILSTYRARFAQPRIPLGARGTFLGTAYEAVGFMRRQVTVAGVAYAWSEYLLFNPLKGFRWLAEYEGHWTMLRTAEPSPGGLLSPVGKRFGGIEFKHFQTARAEVTYVAGEFPWRVKVGESVKTADYVAPPRILSAEESEGEITWSVGEYLEPGEVWKAFALPGAPPDRRGVGASQPNPVGDWGGRWRAFGLLAAGAILIHVASLVLCADRVVLRESRRVSASDAEKAWVSGPFEVPGRTSNLALRSRAGIDNAWAYLHVSLLSQEKGTALEFGRELSYYHGMDGGESWSEGSPRDTAYLGGVPAGTYVLRVEPEFQNASLDYAVEVRRDVPRWSFFWWTLLLLALPLAVQGLRWYSFENRRWAESDHPWHEEGDDDDD